MKNSRIEARQARKKGAGSVFVYTGASMRPTFRPGHLLYVRPVARDLTAGDVVVFDDPERDGQVVHRVVAATDEGLVTRGDSNPRNDALPVAYGQVVGRVETAEFSGKFKEVAGGQRGLRAAQRRWAVLALWTRLSIILGAPYRALKASPQARRWLIIIFRPQFVILRLQTENGPLVKYIYHRHTVAVWEPVRARFTCRKPFDLVLFPPQECPDHSQVEKEKPQLEELVRLP
jgi:signal peptidase I